MSKKIKAVARELSVIAKEIKAELREESEKILNVGYLLIEAKAQVKHGEWLPWLASEFCLTERTAQNYMRAAKFALKYATVSDLTDHDRGILVIWGAAENLSPTALYEINEYAEETDEDRLYTPAAIVAILKEAADKRVDRGRAWEIANSLQPEEEEIDETEITEELLPSELLNDAAEDEAEAKAQAEAEPKAEALLDSTPPDLPPPAPPAPLPLEASVLSSFEQGVELLRGVMTKPASKFKATYFSPSDLKSIADFLQHVAAEKVPRAEAA